MPAGDQEEAPVEAAGEAGEGGARVQGLVGYGVAEAESEAEPEAETARFLHRDGTGFPVAEH